MGFNPEIFCSSDVNNSIYMTRGGLVGSPQYGCVVWTVPVGTLRAPCYFTAFVRAHLGGSPKQTKGESRGFCGLSCRCVALMLLIRDLFNWKCSFQSRWNASAADMWLVVGKDCSVSSGDNECRKKRLFEVAFITDGVLPMLGSGWGCGNCI